MCTRILLVGAGGFLGQRAAKTLANAGELTVLSHEQLDVTDRSAVERAFAWGRPDAAFLTAAISDTGYTQRHPEEAYAINVLGAEHMASACRKAGVKLVYMSSDQVYNGCAEVGQLREDTLLFPETVYGKQKLLCEERVQSILPGAVALRLTWMYDRPDAPGKNGGLLKSLWEAGRAGKALSFATREYRGITNVWRVAEQLPRIMGLPGGIYNCGAGNDLNTYETALIAAKAMDLPDVEKLVLKDETRYASHPRNLLMNTERLAAQGIRFEDTMEGIRLAAKACGSCENP